MVVYGSLSTGFNAPSLYQLYDPTVGYGAVRSKGNKDLDAERSVSMEVGLKHEFGTESYLTVSAFHTRVADAIEYVYLWNKDVEMNELGSSDNRGDTYLNIAAQVTQGIELTGRIGIKKIFIQGNISWIKASITASPNDLNKAHTQGHHVQLYNYGMFLENEVDIDNLTRRPELTGNVTYGYRPFKSLLITLAHRYARSRYDVGYMGDLGPWGALANFDVDSYHLFDAAAHFQINKNWSVGTKVENLSDESYQEILGYATRGRSLYFNVTFRM
jgi:vitamin B12 transporter